MRLGQGMTRLLEPVRLNPDQEPGVLWLNQELEQLRLVPVNRLLQPVPRRELLCFKETEEPVIRSHQALVMRVSVSEPAPAREDLLDRDRVRDTARTQRRQTPDPGVK